MFTKELSTRFFASTPEVIGKLQLFQERIT